MKTVTIELADDTEQQLRTFAAAQNIDPSSAAADLVRSGLQRHSLPAEKLSPEERSKALHEYLNRLPRVNVELIDSRESIYDGRGT